MKIFILSMAFFTCNLPLLFSGDSPKLIYVPNSTSKVCQLTGDTDLETKVPTLSQTKKNFGIFGTDLGSSFEHKGKLYFLFGDTHGRLGDWDAIGWTDATEPKKIQLDFHKDKDGKWLAPVVSGISQKGFEIPSGGISVADTIYVAFTTDHSPKKAMGRSVLASSTDDGRTFKSLYDLSREKFINVSICTADGWLYIFGSGDYRASSVCLARVKPKDIADQSKIEYLSSLPSEKAEKEPATSPRWSKIESDAVSLFKHNVVGEFCVVYLEPVKRYVMLYNSPRPRGIVMRSAATPLGPWSDAEVIFEPSRDGGYGKFMHLPKIFNHGKDDGLAGPNQEATWGGEYGPYIMNRFTAGGDGKCRIYFTMSTWNPYQVVVMQSELKLE